MLSPAGHGQSIAIVDKSGKVVSTSKHILNLLKDAKAAYQERKAEIRAAKEAAAGNATPPRLRRAQTVNDIGSVTSSRRSDRTRHTHKESRHGERYREHGIGSERHRDHGTGSERRRSEHYRHAKLRTPSEAGSVHSDSAQTPITSLPPYTAKDPKLPSADATSPEESPRSPFDVLQIRRAKSSEVIDMDLAYGEPPPNLMMTGRGHNDLELGVLVEKASFLLDEAKCVQHSVKSIMTNLQNNPEAMAAVALTLGEITTLIKKMSPGTLAKIRVAAPAIFGLLTSPQFLIAIGVGAGVTVIALGGYKIIKKIQAKKEEESPDQMIALSSEVNRVESWRQGVADIDLQSVGTSVDGEIMTPMAAKLSKLNVAEEQAISRRKNRAPSVSSAGTFKTSKTSRSRSSKGSTSRDASGTKNTAVVKRRHSGEEDKEGKAKHKPSPLRSLFKP